jgi:O-antigen/teichoic acid export membrane protein
MLPWLFSLIPIYKYFHQPASAETQIHTTKHQDILSVAFPMLMTYAAFIVSNSADVFILKANNVGTDMVGIYKTCTNISMLAATLLVALNTTVQPKITQLYTQQNLKEVHRIAIKSSKLIFWLSVPIFIILIAASKYVMWLYGNEFMRGALCLSILTIGQVINTICGPTAQLLNATGYHTQFRNISFFGAAINIILNLFLVPIYGIEGAAIANSISMIAWNLVCTFYIKKEFGFYIVYIPFLTAK